VGGQLQGPATLPLGRLPLVGPRITLDIVEKRKGDRS
jgi:hypothetical protein